ESRTDGPLVAELHDVAQRWAKTIEIGDACRRDGIERSGARVENRELRRDLCRRRIQRTKERQKWLRFGRQQWGDRADGGLPQWSGRRGDERRRRRRQRSPHAERAGAVAPELK